MGKSEQKVRKRNGECKHFQAVCMAMDLKREVVTLRGYMTRNVCLKTGNSTACMLKAMVSVENNWQ